MLEKLSTYVNEQELPTLLSQIPYIRDNYSSSTLEELIDRNLEIIKRKTEKLFTQFPVNTQEFKDKYEGAQEERLKFLFISLIPRKSDGKVDWIKWKEQQDKEEKLLELEDIKSCLENKLNPVLKKWFDDLKSDPDPVKRLNLLEQQLREHLNLQSMGFWLHKIAKGKQWVDKEYYKNALTKPSYKDASGNKIEIDFPLVVEYDLSKWS